MYGILHYKNILDLNISYLRCLIGDSSQPYIHRFDLRMPVYTGCPISNETQKQKFEYLHYGSTKRAHFFYQG